MEVPDACPACKVNKNFPHVAIVEGDEKEKFDLYRCSKCGLLFVYPIPVNQRHFQEELTRKASFSENWKKGMRNAFRKTLKECENYLSPGARILDFACGYGHFLAVASEAGFYCEGLDISPGAREYIAEHLPDIPIYTQLDEIPSDKEKFDLITAFEVLYYMPNPGETLKKLQLLLRPGGSMISVVSANRGWVIWLLSCIKRAPVRLNKNDWMTSTLLNGRAYYAFSINSLVKLMESAGFMDLRTSRLQKPATEKLRYRIPLFIWLVYAGILRILTLEKIVLHTRAHVVGRYAGDNIKS